MMFPKPMLYFLPALTFFGLFGVWAGPPLLLATNWLIKLPATHVTAAERKNT